MAQISLQEFADRVGEVMHVVVRESLKYQTTEFHKLNITLPQFVVLNFLNRYDESNMTDLAHLMNVTTAAMTGIADRLVRDGYVVRINDPNDRRIIKIRLTTKGARIVKNIIEKRKQMTIKLFGMVSPRERQDYLKILEHIRDHLKEGK